MSIGDQMLSDTALHVEALHGESILVLSGLDVGKRFVAVKEIDPDIVLETEMGRDPRAHRVVRFREPNVPRLELNDRVRTEDGKTWVAVDRPDSAYLTTDFELIEVI